MGLPKSLFKPDQWCFPAIIYAVMIIATLLMIALKDKRDAKDKIYSALTQVLVAFLVIAVMLYACEADLEWISWMMLIIPAVLVIGVYMGLRECRNMEQKQ
jgi:undecaprenyl pyrophosphate phosphatase UppP